MLFQVVELPHKQHLCKIKSLNKGDANSEVTVYYQVGNPSDGLICVVTSSIFSMKLSLLPVETHSSSASLLDVLKCWRCAPQSGLKNLREHALMELMVVSVETHSFPAAAHVLHFHVTCVHRCTWRSRVSTSSGQRRLWGQCHSTPQLITQQDEHFNRHASFFPSRYQVYPTCRNTSGVLGFSITVETQATKFRCWFVLKNVFYFGMHKY